VQGEAAIRRGGREVVWSRDGGVMAIWDPDGTFERAFAIQARDDCRAPRAAGALSVYAVEGPWRDQAIGPHWYGSTNVPGPAASCCRCRVVQRWSSRRGLRIHSRRA
jgi:hypothetical protein